MTVICDTELSGNTIEWIILTRVHIYTVSTVEVCECGISVKSFK